MNNKLLTTLMAVSGFFYASDVSAQFGWGTTAEKPKTEAMKASDGTMSSDMMMTPAQEKTGTEMMAPGTEGAVIPANEGMPAEEGSMMPKAEGEKADMTPAPEAQAPLMGSCR
jgi:hypothetical protein